ncbi:MAG: hypothetical protein B7X12_05225 [Halothiobacillus sp. 20-53-49]|nr:MAG: hypothetical protein B7X12_05225 [Halothiobacillus sp. 20-53-49]
MPSKPKPAQRLNRRLTLSFAGLLGLLVAAVLLLIVMAWPVAPNQAVEWLRLLAKSGGRVVAAFGVGAGCGHRRGRRGLSHCAGIASAIGTRPVA